MAELSLASRALRLVAAALAFAGLWQLGGAVWIEAKAWLAQDLLERAWTAAKVENKVHRPWPWADTWPVARLFVPELGIDRMVLSGASGRTLAFGPAELEGLEESGVVVISGHRDTHFAFLRDMEPGQDLRLERPGGETALYRVVATEVIDASSATLRIGGSPENPGLALVTCWPFDALHPNTPWRFVVSALPVQNRDSRFPASGRKPPAPL